MFEEKTLGTPAERLIAGELARSMRAPPRDLRMRFFRNPQALS